MCTKGKKKKKKKKFKENSVIYCQDRKRFIPKLNQSWKAMVLYQIHFQRIIRRVWHEKRQMMIVPEGALGKRKRFEQVLSCSKTVMIRSKSKNSSRQRDMSFLDKIFLLFLVLLYFFYNIKFNLFQLNRNPEKVKIVLSHIFETN